MIIMIWLDVRCADDDNLDRKDLYRTNYERRSSPSPAPSGRADGGRVDRQSEDGEALRLEDLIEY